MVFIISEPEIEKSHVDMVSVSNLKMEATIATVLKTAAQMNQAFVSNLKSQVRFFIQIQTQSNWPISSYRPYFGTQKINHSSKSRISLILNASKKNPKQHENPSLTLILSGSSHSTFRRFHRVVDLPAVAPTNEIVTCTLCNNYAIAGHVRQARLI